MNRATRRQLVRAVHCALCPRPLSKGDRAPYRRPSPNPEQWGLMETVVAHPRCIAAAEKRRADSAEAALARLTAAAEKYTTRSATADRAQTAGLWLPDGSRTA